MKVTEWQREQGNTLYALIDGGQDNALVPSFYQLGGLDAYPLFAGTPFADQALQGPWLLPSPSQAFIDAYPQLAGFYLLSSAPGETVRHHWQSLIEAVREGEVVWFRYSDKRIFQPMLTAMTQDELDALLGPCDGLMLDGKTWQRSDRASFTPRPAPWFHIRPHHLAALYDENRHAYILRRRLWQTMTAMMERHSNPAASILPILQQANRDGLSDDIRDGVVAGALTLQAGLPLPRIQAPLMLSETELAQVSNWLHKHDALTGVE
jgi:hypothetical protein